MSPSSRTCRAQRGELRLACADETGRPLVVKVYGQDAADVQLLAKAWRYLWYRHGGETLTITRREQVEHEALVTLLAQRAGVTTSDLVTTGLTASGDRLLVVAPRFAGSGRVELGPEHLDAAWSQLGALHQVRMAHGHLDHEHVAGAADGGVALDDWAMATCEASEAMLLADFAALLVLSATVAGQERAHRRGRASRGQRDARECDPVRAITRIALDAAGQGEAGGRRPRGVARPTPRPPRTPGGSSSCRSSASAGSSCS